MPSIFLSHQAPGVLCKLAAPRIVDGTAFCIAATLPDFELVFYRTAQCLSHNRHPWHWGVSHNLIGLFALILPITLVGTFLFSKWLGPGCAWVAAGEGRFSRCLTYFGVDQWSLLKKKTFTLHQWGIIFYSALLGGISHLILDAFTHQSMNVLYPLTSRFTFHFSNTRWIDLGHVGIGPLKYPIYLDAGRASWLIVSTLTAIAALWGLRQIAKSKLLQTYYSK